MRGGCSRTAAPELANLEADVWPLRAVRPRSERGDDRLAEGSERSRKGNEKSRKDSERSRKGSGEPFESMKASEKRDRLAEDGGAVGVSELMRMRWLVAVGVKVSDPDADHTHPMLRCVLKTPARSIRNEKSHRRHEYNSATFVTFQVFSHEYPIASMKTFETV